MTIGDMNRYTNGDMIRRMSNDELAGCLFRWIWRCTRYCPALGTCRGQGCQQALRDWLEEEADKDGI